MIFKEMFYVHFRKEFSLLIEDDQYKIYFKVKNSAKRKLLFSSTNYYEACNKFKIITNKIFKESQNMYHIRQFKNKMKKLGLRNWNDNK